MTNARKVLGSEENVKKRTFGGSVMLFGSSDGRNSYLAS